MRSSGGGIHAAFWVFCAASISGEPLHGAEEFRLFTETVQGSEDNEVTRYVLLVEGGRFYFIPPPGWSVRPDTAKKTISLLPEDLKAGITMKFVLGPNEDMPELKRAELREGILERYPKVRFKDEFEWPSGDGVALVFDCERIVGRDIKAVSRIAFVSLNKGRVEFELTTAADKLEDYHVAFGRLLNSFRNAAFTPKE